MSNIVINIDYLKSWNGIFKLLQLVLGAICIVIISDYFNTTNFPLNQKAECFFLIATSSFFIGTFIFLISYLVSPFTASILPKTIHERLYHLFAAIILLASSTNLMIEIHRINVVFNYKTLLAASICGLLNTILYVFSTSITFMTNWMK